MPDVSEPSRRWGAVSIHLTIDSSKKEKEDERQMA
jgi:hypothetical protein